MNRRKGKNEELQDVCATVYVCYGCEKFDLMQITERKSVKRNGGV